MSLLGMLGLKFGGGGSKQTQTTQNSSGVDPYTQHYIQGEQNAAINAGISGPGPLLNGASQYGTQAQTAGNLGFGALSGDPNSVSQLMNPYTSNVIDQNNNYWQKVNAQTQNQVNSAATQAGAFGGSRYGVALGQALANNNAAQQQQTAGLLSQGFGQAMGQANQLAGYGFQGAGLNTNLGFAGVGSPNLWMQQMMKQGYMGPTGQQSSGVTRGTNVNGNFQVGG